jgi:hypothetical protein
MSISVSFDTSKAGRSLCLGDDAAESLIFRSEQFRTTDLQVPARRIIDPLNEFVPVESSSHQNRDG